MGTEIVDLGLEVFLSAGDPPFASGIPWITAKVEEIVRRAQRLVWFWSFSCVYCPGAEWCFAPVVPQTQISEAWFVA